MTSLIFQISKFYSFYTEYSAWQYVDWLINYQGGFVRRGLIGEFLFQIHNMINLDLDILVFTFVSFLYLMVSFFLIKTIKYLESSQLNTLIFLSPGFFLYQIMNSEVIGRKDMLFLLVIAFFVFFEKRLNNKNLFVLLILLVFFLSLSHSIFLFYSPYLFFLFFLIKSVRKVKVTFAEIIISSTSLFVIFFLIYFNQGDELIVSEICNSVKNFVNSDCEIRGQMFWLGNNAESHISVQYVNFNHFLIYLLSIILVFFFIFIKFYNSKFKINNLSINKFNPALLLLILFLLTLPVYYLGSDWGRYIYLSFSGSFFIFIFCIKEKLFLKNYEIKFNKIFFILLVIIYSFSWTFPFYHAEQIKFTLKKPILKIVESF
ncbi:hypothetical protein [Candidatus Pelagibacter communis]|uniref:hypothetical protein n=1 Tax=Pelagibacter ubique TaxID=198252 RepID=UPI00117802C3|nr:hypothetical protein [Candidatus Pelagibacter ubique]